MNAERHSPPTAPPPAQNISLQLDALFEEYGALYGLVTFRMSALDRRMPVTAGAITAVIGGLDAVGPDAQLLLLLGTPLALVWFVRTTVNHARSFEDVLRRIEEIERTVSALLGVPGLIRFQSRHPSRRGFVGGRTGRESVSAVVATTLVLLAAAMYRMHRGDLLPPKLELAYAIALATVGIISLWEAVRLGRYRYAGAADLVFAGGGDGDRPD